MRRKDVKTVIAYYFGIPAMRVLLADERAELEDEYNGLHRIDRLIRSRYIAQHFRFAIPFPLKVG